METSRVVSHIGMGLFIGLIVGYVTLDYIHDRETRVPTIECPPVVLPPVKCAPMPEPDPVIVDNDYWERRARRAERKLWLRHGDHSKPFKMSPPRSTLIPGFDYRPRLHGRPIG